MRSAQLLRGTGGVKRATPMLPPSFEYRRCDQNSPTTTYSRRQVATYCRARAEDSLSFLSEDLGLTPQQRAEVVRRFPQVRGASADLNSVQRADLNPHDCLDLKSHDCLDWRWACSCL